MKTHSRRYQLLASGNALALTASHNDIPTPGARQVLVRITAASLNYRDLLTRGDVSGSRQGLVPLSDGAGTVVAVGRGVTGWRLGDRVSPAFFPTWLDGRFSTAHLAHALGGGGTDGVLADHVLADETALVAVAAHLTDVEAATLPCAGVTAWHALFERGNLQAGETVLVQGTGGVALFGLQLAHAHGARVIVTSSSDAKLERARALGAWQTINYRTHPDWDRLALEMTDGKGVDHILELGGPDTYNRSISAIAAGGRIAQIGVLTGFNSQPNMVPLQFKNASVDGICVGSVAHFDRLNQFMHRHQLRPVVDEVFAFDDAERAYGQLASAGHFGKLVVDMASTG